MARARRRPVSARDIDESFYGGNLGNVVQSRIQAASNLLSGTTASADIRKLQTALNSSTSNLARLVVDGVAGTKTIARLREYQTQHRLPVNGNVNDPITLAVLYGAGGALGVAPPPPAVSGDYYVRGTPFLWLVPVVEVGFALSFDPFADAQAALSSSLASSGYNVRVVALRGGALEVSGSQNIDRASVSHVRDQITNYARSAGFVWDMPIQFNLQRSGSPFQIGSPGATATYGDRTPVVPKDALTELGVNPFSKDPGAVRNIPSLSSFGGGTGTILLIVAAGLIVAKVLRG